MLLTACIALAAPVANAQRHQGAKASSTQRKEKTTQTHQSARPAQSQSARPAQSARPTQQQPQSSRPGLGSGNNGNHNNNGNSGNHNNNGNSGNHNWGNNSGNHNNGNSGNRPGLGTGNNGNHNNGNNGNHNGWNNGNNGNHNGWVNGNNRPAAPRPPVVNPPHRPYRPAFARPAYRPTPPPAWRPRTGLPAIRGILGLTFGVAFNTSLDYLLGNGYTVDGYGNNIVYLRNVNLLNLIWTDGALYYGNGGLDASSFYYSTPYYDPARYNLAYNQLIGLYGYPVSTSNSGGVMQATWFGNQGYVTLSLGAGSAGRFLTTLTFGL